MPLFLFMEFIMQDLQNALEEDLDVELEATTAGDFHIQANSTDKKDLAVLCIAKWNCLHCKYLCADHPKGVEYDCITLSNCPANHISIEIGVDVEAIATKIAEARIQGDMKTYSRRVARLSKFSARQSAAILSRVDVIYTASRTI